MKRFNFFANGPVSASPCNSHKFNRFLSFCFLAVTLMVSVNAWGWAYSQHVGEQDGRHSIKFTNTQDKTTTEWYNETPCWTVTFDMTLYAKLEDPVTVTFNSNYGSAVASQTIERDSKATQPTDPTKSENEFKGWYQNADFSGDQFDFANTTIEEDITLYAKWNYNGTTYMVNGSNLGITPWNDQDWDKNMETMPEMTNVGDHLEYGVRVAFLKSNDIRFKLLPCRTHFAVSSECWNNCRSWDNYFSIERSSNLATYEREGNNNIQFNLTAEGAYGITICYDGVNVYSKIEPLTLYTVTFMNGTSEFATQQVAAGYNPTKPATDPEKAGYTFLGWSETEGGDVVDVTTVTILDDKTFYAKWALKGVESVTLNQTSLKLVEKGTTGTITISTISPSDVQETTTTWSSDNENVATVNNGVVTPVAKGTATITCTVANATASKSATCVVTVKGEDEDCEMVLTPIYNYIIGSTPTGGTGATDKLFDPSKQSESEKITAVQIRVGSGDNSHFAYVDPNDTYVKHGNVSSDYAWWIKEDAGDCSDDNQSRAVLTTTFYGSKEFDNPNYKQSPIVKDTKSYYRFANGATVTATSNMVLRPGDVVTVYCYNPGSADVSGTLTIGTENTTISLTAGQKLDFEYTVTAKGATTAIVASNSEDFCVAGIEIARELPDAYKGPNLVWETDLSGGVTQSVEAGAFTHTASSKSAGEITYSSSVPAVATVNATTGEVTPVAAGTTVITATIEQAGCYDTGTASYNVTLTDLPKPEITFVTVPTEMPQGLANQTIVVTTTGGDNFNLAITEGTGATLNITEKTGSQITATLSMGAEATNIVLTASTTRTSELAQNAVKATIAVSACIPDGADIFEFTLTGSDAAQGQVGEMVTPTLTFAESNVTMDVKQSQTTYTQTATPSVVTVKAIEYTTDNAAATINANGQVTLVDASNIKHNTVITITATMPAVGCYNEATASYTIRVKNIVPEALQTMIDETEAGGSLELIDDYSDCNATISKAISINANGNKVGDLTVDVDGKLTLTGAMTANNLYLAADQAGHKSGQLRGVDKLTLTGTAYMDLSFANAQTPLSAGWYTFTVPFKVSSTQGIYNVEEEGATKLVNETDYAIMNYQGAVRAEGKYGWIKTSKVGGMLLPGTLYIIAFGNSEYDKIRFVKASGDLNTNTVAIHQFDGGADTDAGWNGVGNPTLAYGNATNTGGAEHAQFLDHEGNAFIASEELITNQTYIVSSAFFIQASQEAEMTFAAPATNGNLYAPRRAASEGNSEFMVEISQAGKTHDRIFLSASDDANATYEIGHDLVKLGAVDGAAKVAQMAINGYNMSLCDAEFAFDSNNEAIFPLTITAPKTGAYTLDVKRACEGQTITLLQNGQPIVMQNGQVTLDLVKGTTTEYSLVIGRTKSDVVTGNGQVVLPAGVSKILLHNHLYIIKDNKVFGTLGESVNR